MKRQNPRLCFNKELRWGAGKKKTAIAVQSCVYCLITPLPFQPYHRYFWMLSQHLWNSIPAFVRLPHFWKPASASAPTTNIHKIEIQSSSRRSVQDYPEMRPEYLLFFLPPSLNPWNYKVRHSLVQSNTLMLLWNNLVWDHTELCANAFPKFTKVFSEGMPELQI